MSALADSVRQLQERIDRLEGQQARIQADVTAQLRRADIAVEDLVAALEALRTRVEALARGETPAPR